MEHEWIVAAAVGAGLAGAWVNRLVVAKAIPISTWSNGNGVTAARGSGRGQRHLEVLCNQDVSWPTDHAVRKKRKERERKGESGQFPFVKGRDERLKRFEKK